MSTVINVTLCFHRTYIKFTDSHIPHSLEESNPKMVLSISAEIYKTYKNILLRS